MYAITPVYKSIHHFDSNVIQTSMYSMKPYYSGIMENDQQQLSSSSIDLPSGPLPIPTDLDLEKDHDARMALEDLLSRQMLLLCRLNDLERKLIDVNDIQIKQEKFVSKLLKPLTENYEDIVIHFDLDHPPTTLLTVLSFMIKDSPELFLINYHVHSSLHGCSSIIVKQFQMKQQDLNAKLEKINFRFNTLQDNSDRLKRKIIIKFIAKKFYDDNNQMEAIFKSNQPSIKGELNIIQHLCLMISANDSNECDELWKLLQPPNDLQSDRYCIEKLGRYFIGLGERRFLFNHPQPQLIDIIIWSLANRSRALRSLMDAKWYKVIESMLMSV